MTTNNQSAGQSGKQSKDDDMKLSRGKGSNTSATSGGGSKSSSGSSAGSGTKSSFAEPSNGASAKGSTGSPNGSGLKRNASDSSSRSSKGSVSENRSFASMDPEKQREIASMGGKAAHESGNGHEFTTEQAREAGRHSHDNDSKSSSRSSGANSR